MGIGRKVTVGVVTVIQLVLFAVLLTWHVTDWQRQGWTGLGFSPQLPAELDGVSEALVFGARSRQVSTVAPGSPAARADVSKRDFVVSVDGIDVADREALHERSRAAGHGDSITYVLERDGEQRELVLTLESPFRSPYVISNLMASVGIGLCWLAISLLVYWSRPESRPATVFFLLCSTGAMMYLMWALTELRFPNFRGILPMSGDLASALIFVPLTVLSVLFANLLLHLSLVFPKRRPALDRWPRLLVWLHALPFLTIASYAVLVLTAIAGKWTVPLVIVDLVVVAGLVLIVPRLVDAVRREGWWNGLGGRPLQVVLLVLLVTSQLGLLLRLVPGRAVIVALLFAATVVTVLVGWVTVYAVLTCIALIRSYRESGVDVRHQIRWPLWGTLTALGGSILLTVFAFVFTYGLSPADSTNHAVLSGISLVSKALYLLIPVGFAFAILKYRLLDIDILIRKTVIYSGVTGIVLASYLILAGVSGLVLVRTVGLQGEVATVVATLAVVALFVPIRSRVQGFVDRRFFQRERDLEAARKRIGTLALGGGDLDEMLARLAEETQRALHSRSVAIFVREGDLLRVAASVGIPDEGDALPALAPGASVFQTGSPIVRPDEAALADDERRTVRRIRSTIMAVASRSGQPVGLISAGPKLGGEDFDDDDETFLRAAADQLLLAVGRSRQSQSEAELERAREIQESLLPLELPQIRAVEVTARWKPARVVGGDYYDALRVGEDRLVLCIGDVVGKGLPAALLMSSLQAALKAVASQVASPKEICSRVREVMLQSLYGGTFITFFLCVIDRAQGRLTYTNAGHNPPLLVRADGTLVRLDVGGPILARIAADVPYQEAAIAIGEGDRLVLYTDGVTEAMDDDEEMFEEERLEAALIENRHASAGELERIITEAVLAHTAGQLQDDLTLVVAAITT